jgi:hypothetical protein
MKINVNFDRERERSWKPQRPLSVICEKRGDVWKWGARGPAAFAANLLGAKAALAA